MNRRWLWILIGVIAFFVVLFAGAVAGAGLTYFALQARPIQAARGIFRDTSSQGDYEAGVLIQHVDEDSPAADAGLKRGDIILAVDGQEIDTTIDMMAAIEDKSAGDEVVLTVQHCESTQKVTIQLEERNGHVYLGLLPSRAQIFDLRPFIRGTAPLQDGNPAFVITRVVSESPADEAGLKPGEMITAIDGERFNSTDELAKIVHASQPGDEIELSIWSPEKNDQREVDVTLGENPEEDGQAYLGIEYIAIPDFSEEALGEGGFFHFEFPESQGENLPIPQLPLDNMPFMHEFLNLPEGVEQVVVVNTVVEGSPAEKAGLQSGDLISSINGEAVSGPGSFAELIRSLEPGDEITLTVIRAKEDDLFEIDIVLGEDPKVDGQAYLGVGLSGFFQFHHIDPSQDEQNPFHFEFQFPWQDENWPQEPPDPIPGDEA